MNEDFENTNDPINNLLSSMFHQIIYPKIDALTVFIPDGQKPSPEIQKVLNEAGPQRWYPKDNGYLVKCPNIFDKFDENLFKLEKDAWDHEHCDKCGNTINSGEKCWASEENNTFYIFCDACYKKLK